MLRFILILSCSYKERMRTTVEGILLVCLTYPFHWWFSMAEKGFEIQRKSISSRHPVLKFHYRILLKYHANLHCLDRFVWSLAKWQLLVILAGSWNHPHILLLETEDSFHVLPGGHLKPGENGTNVTKIVPRILIQAVLDLLENLSAVV